MSKRLIAALWIGLSACSWSAAADYDVGALAGTAPPSLPGKARGVLFQNQGRGPLEFSESGYVVPNVYVSDPSDRHAHDFQIDNKGLRIHLKTGFRRLFPKDAARFALVDVEVNRGAGLLGLNGMLVDHVRIVGHLDQRVRQLGAEVDKLQQGFDARIQPFFHQKQSGRDLRTVEATWLPKQGAISLRFARAVAGRNAVAQTEAHRAPRWNMWKVPYLTVCYRLHPDGKVVSRVVVPPGKPLETAAKYNPGGSPW